MRMWEHLRGLAVLFRGGSVVWVVVPEKDDLDLEEQIGVFGALTEQKE